MKNLAVFHQKTLEISDKPEIVSYTTNYSSAQTLYLSKSGHVYIYSTIYGIKEVPHSPLNLNEALDSSDGADNTWFLIDSIPQTGQIVCISHKGNIVSLTDSDKIYGSNTIGHGKTIEHEGVIETGIHTARWNPIGLKLAIITKDSLMIFMTNQFEVLEEIAIDIIHPSSQVSLSWSSDNNALALLYAKQGNETGESSMAPYSVMIYNGMNYQLQYTGRNVSAAPSHLKATNYRHPTEPIEDGAILLGLGTTVAFSANGTYICVPQKKRKATYQILLLERNGLTHGLIDLQLPQKKDSSDDWDVKEIHWDVTSKLMAISLESETNKEKIIQIYYRNNYYWYLKQQFQGNTLKCLGFDNEYEGRLCLAEYSETHSTTKIRIIDTIFSVASSQTTECSVAVIDGRNIRLTPLGYRTIPPPMFAHCISCDLPCRYASFWTFHQASTACSGVVSLLINGDISLTWLDEEGKPMTSAYLPLMDILVSSQPSSETSYEFWSVVAKEYFIQKDSMIQLALVGSQSHGAYRDVVVLVNIPSKQGQTHKYQRDEVKIDIRHFEGEIGCISYCPDHDGSMSMEARSLRLSVSLSPFIDLAQSAAVRIIIVNTAPSPVFSQDIIVIETPSSPIISTYYCPEVLIHYIPFLIPDTSMQEARYMMIGFSSKKRLYCGETLLSPGISSFAINRKYRILLVVTRGSKPFLHFVHLDKLLDIVQRTNTFDDRGTGESFDEIHLNIPDVDYDLCDQLAFFKSVDPRPVERGARLIAAVPNGCKVVLQQPRGNLESFEPRVLVLLHVQRTLQQSKDSATYYNCLILLRRQRIDLNLLIDFNPQLFVSNIQQFISTVVSIGSSALEMISLLVTALEEEDIVQLKYPILAAPPASNPQDQGPRPGKSIYTDHGKVNFICKVIRNEMMKYLDPLRSSEVKSISINALLHPILCTYAKQQPSLLAEALTTIGTVAATSTAITDSAIKYLILLVDGQKLFDAALSQCDFSMARVIGRLSQMDPKIYLPLLESFENIGKGYSNDTTFYMLMNYKIQCHLNSFPSAIDWGFKIIQKVINILGEAREKGSPETQTTDSQLEHEVDADMLQGQCQKVCMELIDITTKNNLHVISLKHMNMLIETDLQEYNLPTSLSALLTEFFNQLYNSYGQVCVANQQYQEAITTYLSTTPPNAADAVKAAVLSGNWTFALCITNLHGSSQLSAKQTAYNIAHEYKLGLQNMYVSNDSIYPLVVPFAAFSTQYLDIAEPLTESGAQEDGPSLEKILKEGGTNINRATEAARLCIEYCQDVEEAVSILLVAHKWMDAIQVALSHNRRDLLDADIKTTIMSFAKQILNILEERGSKQKELVKELASLWQNPQERLNQVSSTDTLLLNHLTEKTVNIDDSGSEYSAVTVESSASNISSSSRSSRISWMSSISILSDLSAASKSSDATKYSKTESNFAIEGLDHTLLSRGNVSKSQQRKDKKTVSNAGERDPKRYGKKEKREHKRKVRGEGKDIWGIKREGQVCTELWLLADIASVAKTVMDLCDVLLLLFPNEELSSNARTIVIRLQRAMDSYTETVIAFPPPVAPSYPVQWLSKRLMYNVMRYQETAKNPTESQTGKEDEWNLTQRVSHTIPERMEAKDIQTWWKAAAEGIKLWRKIKKVSFA